MIPIIGVKLPIGSAVLLTSTIGGATTNTKTTSKLMCILIPFQKV
jgi:hypothetical protein